MFSLQGSKKPFVLDSGANDGVYQQRAARPSSEWDPLPSSQTRTGPAADGQIWTQSISGRARSVNTKQNKIR